MLARSWAHMRAAARAAPVLTAALAPSAQLLPRLLVPVPARTFAAAPSAAPSLSNTAKAKLEKEKRAKKRRAKVLHIKARTGPALHVDDALKLVRAAAHARFDETVNIQVQLGVDPRKPNQNIRGVAQLPYGTGKAVEIAVFARGEKAEEARRAGATLVGAEDLVEKILKGEVPLTFNKTIATPDLMPLVGKVARVLGPRGLMPNPKLGTVTPNVKEAVAAAKKGQAEFRTEKRGIIAAGIGKVSFPVSELRENLRAFLLAVGDQKPEGFKGSFVRHATLSSTMGPGLPLDASFIDPSSGKFMMEMDPSVASIGELVAKAGVKVPKFEVGGATVKPAPAPAAAAAQQ